MIKKLIKTLMFGLLISTNAYSAAVVFSGDNVKTLKSNIDINGQAKIMSGTVDPSSSATSANKGSLYLNTSNAKLYRKTDNGSSTNWVEPAMSVDSADLIENSSIVGVTASGTMSISIKTKAGTDPTASDFVRYGFRSTTLTSGAYTIESITTGETLAIPGTSKLGMEDSTSAYAVYVYAVGTGSGAKLGVSGAILDESQLYTSVAYTTDADGGKTLVTNAVQTSKPIRLIGQITMQGAPWSGIISVANFPFTKPKHTQTQFVNGTNTITLDCNDSYIWAEPSGGNVTINLPSIATCPMKQFHIFNAANASAFAVITGSGGQTVGKVSSTYYLPGHSFVTLINSSAEVKWIVKDKSESNLVVWGAYTESPVAGSPCAINTQYPYDIAASVSNGGSGSYCQVNFDTGFFNTAPVCTCANFGGTAEPRICSIDTVSTTAVRWTIYTDAGAGSNNNRQVICVGTHN